MASGIPEASTLWLPGTSALSKFPCAVVLCHGFLPSSECGGCGTAAHQGTKGIMVVLCLGDDHYFPVYSCSGLIFIQSINRSTSEIVPWLKYEALVGF